MRRVSIRYFRVYGDTTYTVSNPLEDTWYYMYYDGELI